AGCCWSSLLLCCCWEAAGWSWEVPELVLVRWVGQFGIPQILAGSYQPDRIVSYLLSPQYHRNRLPFISKHFIHLYPAQRLYFLHDKQVERGRLSPQPAHTQP